MLLLRQGMHLRQLHMELLRQRQKGVRLGMVIDMRKFTDKPEMLDGAISACIDAHNVPQFPDKKMK